MNLYNVMVSYDGEGSTNIYIPGLGDTNIIHGRPIYLKNASFNVIEALRQFRKMQINIQIGAKGLGAFRTIDLQASTKQAVRQLTPAKEIDNVSESDIKNILSAASNGPIVIEDTKPLKQETKNWSEYKLPSGQYEGKTLAEVDAMGKLKSVYSGFKSRNPEVKEAVEKYYESQMKSL